jgi:HAD superfamily hydrolase (TIGR01549 family)
MRDPIRAILFDLDGTLLDNDMDQFLPHYFEHLAAWVNSILPPKEFIAHLLQATRAMMANDGRASNEEVFAAAFYPLAGHPRQEMEPIFQDFYAREFPNLRQYSRRKPEARPLVQAALARGYDLVIATNPLFPAAAIEQRMEWAGVADFTYRLVTTYENSRACKPNLLYFQQICQAIGRPPTACLVVGDDAMDMVAARLGCVTFFVADASKELPADIPTPTYRGTLAEVEALL